MMLETISFQHVSMYFDEFKDEHGSISGRSSMKAIHSLILFDRKLQALLMEYIGLFELKFRAQYSYALTEERGPFAHRNNKNFLDPNKYTEFLKRYSSEFSKQLHKNREIAKAYETYGDAPTWLAVEVMSFGTLSRMFQNTKSKAVRKRVAGAFDCDVGELISWTNTLNSVRNTCAHFNKLCGTTLSPRPKRIPGVELDNGNPLYVVLLLARLLRGFKAFEDDNTLAYGVWFTKDVIDLFSRFPSSVKLAGIPDNWKDVLSSEPVSGPGVSILEGDGVKALTKTASGSITTIEKGPRE